jgi:hypothetical protein
MQLLGVIKLQCVNTSLKSEVVLRAKQLVVDRAIEIRCTKTEISGKKDSLQ